MRMIAVVGILLLGSSLMNAQNVASSQQPAYRADVAATYQWIRTNTPNGSCDCFFLNGGDLSASLRLLPEMSAVADVNLGHASDVLGSGSSLTLSSYMAGPRFRLPQSWSHSPYAPEPFAQILLGAAHAGGGAAGAGDRTTVFAARVGGGMDVKLAGGLAVRLFQVDYYLTDFANSTNNHQNNLLLSTGLVYRWAR
jgi:outer membrane immunogenic protein